MISWFLKSIGVSGEMIEHLDEVRLTFQHPVARDARLIAWLTMQGEPVSVLA